MEPEEQARYFGKFPDELSGAQELAAYRVLSDGGFFNAVKCQRCLHSLERDPAPPFGSYVPLGLQIARGAQ